MRIIFMGTPPIAANVLEQLLKNNYDVVAIYTQPPRAAGRGYKLLPSPVHLLGEKNGIQVETPLSLKSPDAQEIFLNYKPDLVIVVAYGLILPQKILETPKHGCLNLHASLLPRWRGAAPIERAILAGDAETGVCVMKMDVGLDTGPVLASHVIKISADTTSPMLLQKMGEEGGALLMRSLPSYVGGRLMPKEQPQEGVTYAHKIEKEEGFLDFNNSASFLERQVRALGARPGTWFFWKEKRYKVLKAHILSLEEKIKPGTILDAPLVIACKEGAFSVDIIQEEGAKPLDIETFLRGHPFMIGEEINSHAAL